MPQNATTFRLLVFLKENMCVKHEKIVLFPIRKNKFRKISLGRWIRKN